MLVKSARDAILVLLPDGSIEDANEAAHLLLGRDPLGLRLADLIHDGSPEALQAHLWREARGPRRAELQVTAAAGRTSTVESVATDLPEGRVMLVMRDITARRKVEEGMIHAARMETVGIIAGGIAHDFNNTMTALMAHIGLLRLKVVDEKDQDRLQRMEAVIRRAAHMTRRLLTMARGGEKDHRPLNPTEPIHSAVELTRSMLPRNITIKERLEPDLPMVMGSADDLEQAVLNLLVNARDALSPTGGVIRVRVRPYRQEGLPAGVRIVVEDNGPGVPDSIRATIWEPFFTTKGEGRGTGLGLSVVARVVREHGGQIDLERLNDDSQAERPGTRFVLTLPTVSAAQPRVVDSGHTDGRRILVVDDEEEIRDLMRAELLSRGYTVTAAASAEEALAIIEELTPEEHPEVLVTDVVMPGMDGLSLAHALGRRLPGLRIVIVSGFIPQQAEELMQDWQRLAKPFSPEQLAVAVRRALLSDPGLLGAGRPADPGGMSRAERPLSRGRAAAPESRARLARRAPGGSGPPPTGSRSAPCRRRSRCPDPGCAGAGPRAPARRRARRAPAAAPASAPTRRGCPGRSRPASGGPPAPVPGWWRPARPRGPGRRGSPTRPGRRASHPAGAGAAFAASRWPPPAGPGPPGGRPGPAHARRGCPGWLHSRAPG